MSVSAVTQQQTWLGEAEKVRQEINGFAAAMRTDHFVLDSQCHLRRIQDVRE